MSGACHWTVNVAASSGHGKLYADAYSIATSGIFVPPESPIRRPEDLKDVPMGKIFAGIMPFWAAMVVCVALLIAFPQIALVLPDSMIR